MTSIYFCGRKCQAKCWTEHKAWHVKDDARREDLNAGGVLQQQNREAAEQQARAAESTGSEYDRLLAEGIRHGADKNYHKADKTYRKAIALEPGQPVAYYNLGNALTSSGRNAQAAPLYLQAAARYPEGSEDWADSIVGAFNKLCLPECAEVAKPGWWSDEALKTLSKAVVRVTDSHVGHLMRADVLAGQLPACESGPRSAADLKEAVTHYERAAALAPAPIQKRACESLAAALRSKAAAMEAAEAEAKAVVRAEAEAKASAVADALLAEEAAAEAAAASAGKVPGKGKAKGKTAKGKGGKSTGKRFPAGSHRSARCIHRPSRAGGCQRWRSAHGPAAGLARRPYSAASRAQQAQWGSH